MSERAGTSRLIGAVPILPAVILLLGFLQLAVVTEATDADLLRSLVLVGGFAVLVTGAAWATASLPTSRARLLPTATTLVAIGLVMVERLAPTVGLPALANRQWVALALGLVAYVVAATQVRLIWLRRYKYIVLALSLGLLVLTAAVGQEVNGARLWLVVGPLQFQPFELAKVGLVVFLAGYLADRSDLLVATWRIGRATLAPLPYLLPIGAAIVVCLGMLVWLNDLGSALLIFGTFALLTFVGTGLTRYVALAGAIFGVAVALAVRFVPRVELRIQNWLDPWVDPRSGGYQMVQSELALAAGGVAGTGLGQGAPDLIPDAHTDFVLAAIGEELGLPVVLAVLACECVIVLRALSIGMRAGDRFEQLLAVGLGASLALQCLLIACGVARLMPLTGLPLPFVSYGGSSLVINFALLGLLAGIQVEHHPGGRAAWNKGRGVS